MAINWDLYNKRLNINGSTNRERNLQSLQNTITNKLPDSLSYKAVKINGVDASIEIVKTTKDYIKVIHSLPNASFDCGDYVLYNGKTYLVTEIDVDDEVYTSGKMQECTCTIKFQSPDGTILSYPCIDESSNTVGINESDVLNTMNSVKRIKLPFCLETDRIKVDDRLFVDKSNKTVYKVTNVNNTEFNYGDKGLIVLTMKADSIQVADGDKPKDRPDLGICNYFEPSSNDNPTDTTYATITCSNPNNEITLGSSVYRVLTPTFYDANGVITTGITALWNFTLPTGYDGNFTIVYEGNLVKIIVSDNYELLGSTVTVEVRESSGHYRGYITLSIVA